MNLMRRFPCIAIPETLVVRNSLADASLWILHLIGSFGSNLSRHLFERFGFGESDGLDNVEKQIEGSSYGIGLASTTTGNDDRDVSADEVREALWFVEIYFLSHAN